MIQDAKLQFSAAQALTVTAPSTNVIDLGVERDVGIGYPLEILCMVPTAFVGGTSLQVVVQTDDDPAFGSVNNSVSGPVVPLASLVIGAEPARLRIDSPTNRYVRLNYVIVGTMTAGAINAAVVLDRQANRIYPSGIPAQV